MKKRFPKIDRRPSGWRTVWYTGMTRTNDGDMFFRGEHPEGPLDKYDNRNRKKQ